VNLKAFCNRFATAAARIWRSASIASPGSTSGTISSRPRTLASIGSGYLGLFDEFRNQGSFTMLRNTSPQANVNQDALAKILQSFEAPIQDGASRSSYSDVAAFYNVHGEHCRVDQLANESKRTINPGFIYVRFCTVFVLLIGIVSG
jgi:hypothetical protein